MRVLVVGTGYIGSKFAEYARGWDSEESFRKNDCAKVGAESGLSFHIEMVSSREKWKNTPFEDFDSIIFAAGVAHRKQTKKNAHEYFEVNRDLAIEVAKKAMAAKVPHFVYISSMAIFGKKQGEISSHTIPAPANNDYYGTSKQDAEEALINLQNAGFSVAIVRPPMVYGEGCPGKYSTLAKIAKLTPVVFCNKNKRSVIYIDNLSEFLCKIICKCKAGFFHPQNDDYVSTSQLIAEIRQQCGKKTRIVSAPGIMRLCMAVCPPVKNAFGTLYYSGGDGE